MEKTLRGFLLLHQTEKGEKTMRVICAYCGKFIREVHDPLGRKADKDAVSHGACEECYKKELEKLKNTKCCVCGRTNKPLLFMSICADCFVRKEEQNDDFKGNT